MSEDPQNLSLIETNALWNELRTRFDCCLLVHERLDNDKVARTDVWWCGGIAQGLGMVEYANWRMRRDLQEYSEKEDTP